LLAEIDKIANTTSIFDKYPLKPEPKKLPPPLTTAPAPAPLPLTSLGKIPSIEDKFPVSGTTVRLASGLIPVAYIPAGTVNISVKLDSYGWDDDVQIFTRSGKHILGTPLDDSVWKSNNVFDAVDITDKVMTEDNAFDAGASYDAGNLLPAPPTHDLTAPSVGTYNGMTFSYSGDGDRFELGTESNNGLIVKSALEAFTIDETTEDLIVMVVGRGVFQATTSWGFMPTQNVPTPPAPPTLPAPPLQIQSQEPSKYPILLDAHFQETQHYLEIERTPSDTQALGITEYSILGQSNALKAIEQIDGALQLVGDYRARYGSYNNVLDRAIHGTMAEIENNSSARSRILDTDYAKETTELTKSQITQQAGTAILAQANALPRSILSLLD
jgi:flagellin